MEDMLPIVEADIYIQGHDHDRWTRPAKPIMRPYIHSGSGEVRMRERNRLLVRSGSFLKGYEVDSPSYVVDRMFQPLSIGGVEIKIELKRIKDRTVVLIKGEA